MGGRERSVVAYFFVFVTFTMYVYLNNVNINGKKAINTLKTVR